MGEVWGVCVCVCVRNISEVEVHHPWSQLGRGLTFIKYLLCASYPCQGLCINGSQLGAILSLRDIWQCVETFLVVISGEGVLPASSGYSMSAKCPTMHRMSPSHKEED